MCFRNSSFRTAQHKQVLSSFFPQMVLFSYTFMPVYTEGLSIGRYTHLTLFCIQWKVCFLSVMGSRQYRGVMFISEGARGDHLNQSRSLENLCAKAALKRSCA